MTQPAHDPQAHSQSALEQLVAGNTAFALALYQQLCAADGNLCFSPYSLSTALAMTYGGARGETARQMAHALHFLLPQEQLHSAFAELGAGIQEIAARGAVQLNVANALWPHVDYPFLKDFLTLTRRCYGVTTTPVDYSDTERARITMNDWVAAQTADKIQNLIPAGTLDALTRLVLVNAIYFKGTWANPFAPPLTRPAPFWLTPNESVPVPFMTHEHKYHYTENAEAQILELPYADGNLSMILLLPRAPDGLAALEQAMTREKLAAWFGDLTAIKVMVALPRFKFTTSFRLNEQLQAMGMVDAFGAAADFSGMDGTQLLYIGAVLHQTFIAINEEGTEAAAATAVEMKMRSAPQQPPIFRADHPFLFLILEKRTGSILFLGRVVNPT